MLLNLVGWLNTLILHDVFMTKVLNSLGMNSNNFYPKQALSQFLPLDGITEKIQSTQQGHKKSHNVGTRLLSGFLVSFASGAVEWNCWMKQQSNTQKQGALTAIQTGCLGALHGSQSLTALNR